jgi:hypothetical protein
MYHAWQINILLENLKKRPFGKPDPKWKDNIKVILKKYGDDVDWVLLAQDKGHWRVLPLVEAG